VPFFSKECKNAEILYEEQDTDDNSATRRRASSVTFGVEYPDARCILFQPYVSVSANHDAMSHKAVHSLIEAQLEKSCKKQADRQVVSVIWSEMLIPMFNLPLHWFIETLRKSAFTKKNMVLTKCKYQHCLAFCLPAWNHLLFVKTYSRAMHVCLAFR
jgi:hypothetical protein